MNVLITQQNIRISIKYKATRFVYKRTAFISPELQDANREGGGEGEFTAVIKLRVLSLYSKHTHTHTHTHTHILKENADVQGV